MWAIQSGISAFYTSQGISSISGKHRRAIPNTPHGVTKTSREARNPRRDATIGARILLTDWFPTWLRVLGVVAGNKVRPPRGGIICRRVCKCIRRNTFKHSQICVKMPHSGIEPATLTHASQNIKQLTKFPHFAFRHFPFRHCLAKMGKMGKMENGRKCKMRKMKNLTGKRQKMAK